jgi:hypothetical protein
MALMREVQREADRTRKLDGYESATCRHLGDCWRSLSEAFKVEQRVKGDRASMRPRRAARDRPGSG